MIPTAELALDALLADPLRRVRATGNALGYVGADVPLDLLLATGRTVAHLPWVADRPTPRADQWLESSFPGWARSILEDWATGAFDGFADVVFSRGHDAAQRLYYYVCELQRRGHLGGPRPWIYDAAYIPREASLQHLRGSLDRLCRMLQLDAVAVAHGIGQANRLRGQLAAANAARTSHGPLFEKLNRASLFADVSAVLEGLTLPGGAPTSRRVLLAGSAPPDDRLHQVVEDAGGSVIAERHEYASGRLGPPIDAADVDPLAAIARQRRSAPVGPRAFVDVARGLREAATAVRADAVVLWLTQDDEALAWHVPAQRAALAEAGIPALVLPARRWDLGDGADAEITSFMRTLR